MAISELYGEGMTIPGLLAGADLSSNQYYPVKFASTAGEVVKATAATDAFAGVLQNDPVDGDAASVIGLGAATVRAGTSTITYGSKLTANSSGAITTTTDTNTYFAVALAAPGAVGDLIPCWVVGQQLVAG